MLILFTNAKASILLSSDILGQPSQVLSNCHVAGQSGHVQVMMHITRSAATTLCTKSAYLATSCMGVFTAYSKDSGQILGRQLFPHVQATK